MFFRSQAKVGDGPQALRENANNGTLIVQELNSQITIHSNGNPVLVYNIESPKVPEGMDPLYHRSGFIHPVTTPSGACVTAAFPVDHAHQHGIFSAWVQTQWNDRNIDFWNLAKGAGRVLHQRVVSTFAENDRVGFEVDLIHRAEQSPVVDILRERWKVTAIPTAGSYHTFDIESTQFAQSNLPLTIQKYHYGGMAVRGPVDWLLPETKELTQGKRDAEPVCTFLNDLGSDRIQGNHEHVKWVRMAGANDGKMVSITVFCHPNNFRAPQAARLHPTKPYFVFSPCVDGDFVIDRDHPLHAQYRFIVADSAPDAEWLNEQWKAWATSPIR